MNCRFRILERALSTEHIKQTIREPDIKRGAGEGTVKVWKRLDAGVRIVVVYSQGRIRNRKNDYFVITAYYL